MRIEVLKDALKSVPWVVWRAAEGQLLRASFTPRYSSLPTHATLINFNILSALAQKTSVKRLIKRYYFTFCDCQIPLSLFEAD